MEIPLWLFVTIVWIGLSGWVILFWSSYRSASHREQARMLRKARDELGQGLDDVCNVIQDNVDMSGLQRESFIAVMSAVQSSRFLLAKWAQAVRAGRYPSENHGL